MMSAPEKCNEHISILKHFETTPDEEGKMKITSYFFKRMNGKEKPKPHNKNCGSQLKLYFFQRKRA